MTREKAILVLDSLSTWLGYEKPITEEIVEAIKILSNSSLPSNLDEAAEEWCKINNKGIALSADKKSHYLAEGKDAFKAGAEWMMERGINISAHIFMPSGIKPVYDHSKGEYPAAVHLDCGGSLVLEKRLKGFNHREEVIVQIRKK